MFLHYKADRINFIRGLTSPVLIFFPYYAKLPEGYEILALVIIFLLISSINHVLHLHTHRPFSKSNFLNLTLDIFMGLSTAMTASNWRIQHKYGHHSKERGEFCKGYDWEMEKYTILGAISYSSRTLFPIFYLPISEAFEKGVKQNIKTPINYRWAFFEQIIFIFIIIGLLLYKPFLTLGWLLPIYLIVLFTTRYTDYLNHFGCADEKYKVSNNCINKTYNFLGNNFGYHTAHHLYGGAHWTDLPMLHEKIKDQIPEYQLKTYSWSGLIIFYHFYLSLKGKM